MTGIKEFLRKINDRPSSMMRVNWKDETHGFKYRRIRSIIVGIVDDETCKLARDYMINTWCDMGRDVSEIESILNKCFDERTLKNQQKHRKQALDEKAGRLDKKAQQSKEADNVYEPYACDNLFSNYYYQEYRRLQKENEKLIEELEKYDKNSLQSVSKIRTDGIRSVVEQLIIYGEGFPCNQNDKAEIIKEALLAKSFNGHIPSEALTPEWKARLMNLGRKEIGMTFQGESMFKISGNDQVNIGGNNGRE